jgi:hypothetical protein
VDSEFHSYSALFHASDHGHASVVEFLLQKGATIGTDRCYHADNTPLVAATRKGHAGIVRRLLAAMASHDHTSRNSEPMLERFKTAALKQACFGGNVVSARSLIEHHAKLALKVNNMGYRRDDTILHLICSSGDGDMAGIVRLILEQPGALALINNFDDAGHIALHHACLRGLTDVTQLSSRIERSQIFHAVSNMTWGTKDPGTKVPKAKKMASWRAEFRRISRWPGIGMPMFPTYREDFNPSTPRAATATPSSPQCFLPRAPT